MCAYMCTYVRGISVCVCGWAGLRQYWACVWGSAHIHTPSQQADKHTNKRDPTNRQTNLVIEEQLLAPQHEDAAQNQLRDAVRVLTFCSVCGL